MNILKKLDLFNESANKIDQLNESGIYNIKALAKRYKEAEIYYHIDSDGFFSCLGMIHYLKKYNIKTTKVHTIQYGGSEFAVAKPTSNTLAVMVDFAHGKPMMHIHTDHHDSQVGHSKDASTVFKHAKSNFDTIATEISPHELFPPADIKTINTVDSADFLAQGLTPDDIMRAAFKVDRNIPVERNRMMMGLVVNKLLLAYKNKPNFLNKLVMMCSPSMVSVYVNIKKLALEYGLKPEELQAKTDTYVKSQLDKSRTSNNISDVKTLKNGENILIGNIIIQYGGGYMMKGGYDRYTPFKNNPSGEFLVIGWPMGLVQASKNPFKKDLTGIHLGELAQKALSKNRSKLNKMITLDTIKYMFEKDIKDKGMENAVGFTMADLLALYKGTIKGNLKGLQAAMNKKYSELTIDEKNKLKQVEINLWDIIQKGSGGHKNITNISGLNFMGKGYTDFLKELMMEITKEIKSVLK